MKIRTFFPRSASGFYAVLLVIACIIGCIVLVLLSRATANSDSSGAAEVPSSVMTVSDNQFITAVSDVNLVDGPAPSDGLLVSELPVDYYPEYEPLGDLTVVVNGPSCSGGTYGDNTSFTCWVDSTRNVGMYVNRGNPTYGALPSFGGNVTIGDSIVSGHIDAYGARGGYTSINEPLAASNQTCFADYPFQGNLPVIFNEFADAAGNLVNTYVLTLPDGTVAMATIVDLGTVVKATFSLTGVGDFTVTAVETLPASGTFLLGGADDIPTPCLGAK